MGFLNRVANLWNGFWGLFLTSTEQKNPEIVYEAAISARIAQHAQLKKAVAGIIYLRNRTAADLSMKSEQLQDVFAQIPVAIESGDDDVAMVLLQHKNELEPAILALQTELEKIQKQADEAKDSLIAFRADIEKLRREKDEMLAKKATAEARIQIQETLDGLSTDADIKALENVRESINKKAAEADVGSEINGSSLDVRLKKIKAKTGDATARLQLEEMKRSMAQVAQPQKTM